MKNMNDEDDTYWTAFCFEGFDDPNDLHCTHKFLGNLSARQVNQIDENLREFFEAHPVRPFILDFLEPDLFGPMKDVKVFKCDPFTIPKIYTVLREILDVFRIDDYSSYRPHITFENSQSRLRVSKYVLMKGEDILVEWHASQQTSYYANQATVKKKSKSIELKPVSKNGRYKDELEKRVKLVFKELLYIPLMKLLSEPLSRLENSKSALQKALESGRVTHHRGVFTGKFSATVSKELKALGAKWSGGVWTLPLSSLPPTVRRAIESSENRFLKKLEQIDKKLRQILPAEIAGHIKTADLFSSELFRLESEINQSLKDISVPVQLTKAERKAIADGWANNMKLSIETFADDEIKKLRSEIGTNAAKGLRYEGLVKSIQESYGVSTNKAKFLARQETNLLMSEFEKTKYLSVGSDQYKWKCVVGAANHPVRHLHKILDNTIQRWENPPITSEDGSRNNPGQDYNCRCYAIPIVTF